MREIKFRVWHTMEKNMFSVKELEFFGDDMTVGSVKFTLSERISVNYAILMQFTGLKDKNGKEIYEGDVIKFQTFANWDDDGEFPRHVASVVFENGGFCWNIAKEGYQGHYSANKIDQLSKTNSIWGLEVIGNIYKNPELL